MIPDCVSMLIFVQYYHPNSLEFSLFCLLLNIYYQLPLPNKQRLQNPLLNSSLKVRNGFLLISSALYYYCTFYGLARETLAKVCWGKGDVSQDLKMRCY
jgi:hypothetical protein